MKVQRFLQVIFLLANFSISVWAVDYVPDATFNSGLANGDIVHAVHVQPDGKIIIGGELHANNGTAFIRRINPDGSIDPTFNAPISDGDRVSKIIALPGGQYFIIGNFVASSYTYYARLNANGSLDTSLQINSDNFIKDVQADGKLLGCSTPTSGTYINRRFNSNGSVDPTFNLTFAEARCPEMLALPDGKIMVAGEFRIGGQLVDAVYRLNADGSHDPTFDTTLVSRSNVTLLGRQPDGKFLVSYGGYVYRLNTDGTEDFRTRCSGSFVLQLADGNFFMSECSQPPNSPRRFARVFSDGQFDRSLDHVSIVARDPYNLTGMQPDGNGGYYLYGDLSSIRGTTARGIGHIVPDTSRLKAKYDFDGDGKSDIAVYRPSNGMWYLMQSTEGAKFFSWGIPGDVPVASDYDTDGRTDIGIYRPGEFQLYSSAHGHKYLYLGQAGDKPMVGSFNSYISGKDIAVVGPRGGVLNWLIRHHYYTNSGANPFPNVTPVTVPVSSQLSPDKPVVGDFNADGREEIGYFREGQWYSVDFQSPSLSQTFQWGSAGDIPVPEDYDGDRQTDYAVFRPSNGTWWINLSTGGYWVVSFGLNGDIPVPADYDGDGKADISVYRNGDWYQYLSATGTIGGTNWGLAGDLPIPAQLQ